MRKSVLLFGLLALLTCNYHAYGSINFIAQPAFMDESSRLVYLHNCCHDQARGGFFSEFNNLIANLIYYECDGIQSVYVDWTHPRFLYKDNLEDNAWDLYFEPVTTEAAESHDKPITTEYTIQNHELHDHHCSCIWTRYDDYLPFRLFAHNKIKQHIRIKQHVLDAVESCYIQHLENKICIGVHVRYAQKHEREAPFGHPSLMAYKKAINKLLKKHNANTIIYLATDSHYVTNEFSKTYGTKLIYLDTYRAEGELDHNQAALMNKEQYHELKAGYRGGLGTLMDCLLLSRCDYFIHITSNLAKAVSFFNPYITSIFLPKNAPYVPCRYYGNPKMRNPFINPI